MHPKVAVTTTGAKLLRYVVIESIPNILEAKSFIAIKVNWWGTLNVFRTHWYEENLNLYGVTLELEGHQPTLLMPMLVHKYLPSCTHKIHVVIALECKKMYIQCKQETISLTSSH